MFCPNCQYYSCLIPREPCPKCHAKTTAIYDNGRKVWPMSDYDLENPPPTFGLEPKDGEQLMVSVLGEGPVLFVAEYQGSKIVLHRVPQTVKLHTYMMVDNTPLYVASCTVCANRWVRNSPFKIPECPLCEERDKVAGREKSIGILRTVVHDRWSEAAAYVACDHECPCERRLLERGLQDIQSRLASSPTEEPF